MFGLHHDTYFINTSFAITVLKNLYVKEVILLNGFFGTSEVRTLNMILYTRLDFFLKKIGAQTNY